MIRPVNPSDREQILSILGGWDAFNEEEVLVAMELVDDVLSKGKNSDYLIFCDVDGRERVEGYICFGRIPLTDFCYDLYWIAVDRSSARRGVGRRLLTFMEEDVRHRGGRKVYIDTSSTSGYGPARDFYEHHGYRVVCTIRDFYRDGDHKVLYCKEI
ncbi:MAG: GNAT family N-acetyltransferase [Deltaproteobacteria bacterium]|nr:GNAT family N-acetyltransferase [Deltaproteobacteria bacterium]